MIGARQGFRKNPKHLIAGIGGRMEIEKAYFTLPEILDRWAISEADLIYLAENDKLRLSVRVFGVPLELGDYEETDGGEHFRIPIEQSHYSGLLELHARDGCCQTNANQSLFSSSLNLLGCAETAPLGQSGGAVQLEV